MPAAQSAGRGGCGRRVGGSGPANPFARPFSRNPRDTHRRETNHSESLLGYSLWSYLVPRTRMLLALLFAALAVGPAAAGPGIFTAKPKTDAARARVLIETLKSDPDEKKRKAAADELGGADARQLPEVVTALTAALQKDASAAVRAEAAETLGQLGQVVPHVGAALEAAAAGDASPAVRLAAKKSLWEYHLNGYRSPKGADGMAAQTIEPPLASPAAPRPASAVVFAPPPPVPSFAPPAPGRTPTPVPQLPAVVPPTGPRVARPAFLADLLPGPRAAVRSLLKTAPPISNMTSEPPLAKRPAVTIPPLPSPSAPVPTVTLEPPPAAVAPRVPDYVPTLPPFRPDLPSVVLPPDATPLAPAPVPVEPKIPPTLPPVR